MIAQTDVLFEPDLPVPSQFLATLRRRALRTQGVGRLLIAVLEDAITCFQNNVHARNKRQRRLFEEAQQWIMGASRNAVPGLEDDDTALSFEYICGVLDIDPADLRRAMQRWGDAQRATAAPPAPTPSAFPQAPVSTVPKAAIQRHPRTRSTARRSGDGLLRRRTYTVEGTPAPDRPPVMPQKRNV